ncbi:sigma-54 dependent transcriptional regulator [Zavarzinia compransoris]|uniref:Sigma-54-dependent Fis family transcriptional regulator n=1 Tax=Zavarzinia compransoris TaxID=1264899 RepID=A0A317E843_9PROT|nr:sigma-54 dependent transcriptional regulator [Zavarzinia compransoris]PWR23109.1 sigma-54-dependent Fis family transcriptional regulator [Zavarzinia compransoris]TDP46339.1 two-component system response regulator HupR/HoxA [Zavarzinia compransoris]
MERTSTILIMAGVSEVWRQAAGLLEADYGYRVLVVPEIAAARAAVNDAQVDLVVAEALNGAGPDGGALLADLRIGHPEIVRILVLPAVAEGAVDLINRTAVYQYLRKPLDAAQLALVVKRGLETRELARRHRLLSREFKVGEVPGLFHLSPTSIRGESQRFEKLVYRSEPMAALCDLARQAAPTDLPILIQGDTGTGKELLARAIHYNSSRRQSPLLIQNCGGMSDELLHSELFGHKRGAFTGAIADRLGLFRAADGGTVFLDEISEISPAFQVSLLRFLQEGEVKPLGADKAVHCNVRIIAASNRRLSAMVPQREFRQDLYFRLKGFELEVPPLRKRADDISILAEFFTAKHAEAMGRRVLGISANLIEKLRHYDYPGNVRELENEIRRLVALTRDGEYLTTRHLSPAILDVVPKPPRSADGFVPEGETLKDKVEALEKHAVQETLARLRWNQKRAAEELGLSRVGLANKIKRYGLTEGK